MFLKAYLNQIFLIFIKLYSYFTDIQNFGNRYQK